MTIRDTIQKATATLVAFTLSCAMLPYMAYAEEAQLPIDSATGTINVTDTKIPRHLPNCDGTDGNSPQDLTTCPSCAQQFYACQVNESRIYVDEDGNEVPEDSENVYSVKFICPECGASLIEGADSNAGIEPLAVAAAISVTVPLVVTFGGSEGYDISNPQPSIEASTAFRNAGNSAIQITRIQTEEYTEGSVRAVLSDTGFMQGDSYTVTAQQISGNDTPLEDQTLYSLYPEGQPEKAVNIKYKDGDYYGGITQGATNNTQNYFGDTFIIGADSALNCVCRLNLTNSYEVPGANALVKQEKADGGKTVQPLSKVKYTIITYVPAGHGNETLSEENSFYLKDQLTNQIYNAQDVKGHAQDISNNGKNSLYYGMYSGYVRTYRPYVCKLRLNDRIEYDLNVIGLLHDTLSNGMGKAGLTFQMKDTLYRTVLPMHNSMQTDGWGGWGQSDLRADMNEESGEIYQLLPTELTNLVATVNKEYGPTSSSKSPFVSISQDKFFIASLQELAGAVSNYSDSHLYAADYLWLYKEGYQYEYYASKLPASNMLDGDGEVMQKSERLGNGPVDWWQRSIYAISLNYDVKSFYYVNVDGNYNVGMESYLANYVCPCFCF
ncbi:DUF6273 domain-containing protein [Adlercreutzia sp. ZJ154]|uniref:DUF6273 domain-containing protein n=1 Tax=Adlercreutzia sp. ZJ154 TaxID=2709790 RepID=UPI0013ECEA9E|nr:DUF6273 domain-containing protein [Adlercreutzia sp. ZJ154]